MKPAEATIAVAQRSGLGSPSGDAPAAAQAPDVVRAEPPRPASVARSRRVDLTAAPEVGWFRRWLHRLEAGISRLSVKNNFWHRVCSWIWLPLAFRSGIKIKKISSDTFSAVLPFRRFNRNWYNAMAGAALLGNSEIAGGLYVFNRCGADYTVVCKHLDYKFLRPCYGPALYRVKPREDLDAKVAQGGEFNVTLEMTIVQMVRRPGEKERRVGRCTATFHATPKAQVRRRQWRRRKKAVGSTAE
ncbi:MAG TPA: hypothetical protein VF184_10590 [Phycisphaeraceae bacterium]